MSQKELPVFFVFTVKTGIRGWRIWTPKMYVVGDPDRRKAEKKKLNFHCFLDFFYSLKYTVSTPVCDTLMTANIIVPSHLLILYFAYRFIDFSLLSWHLLLPPCFIYVFIMYVLNFSPYRFHFGLSQLLESNRKNLCFPQDPILLFTHFIIDNQTNIIYGRPIWKNVNNHWGGILLGVPKDLVRKIQKETQWEIPYGTCFD